MHQIRSVSVHDSHNKIHQADNYTGLFKAQVAAKIGREPHEILLKRQGERPFKDQLTLEDYGVSNGVQLDLSVTPFLNPTNKILIISSEKWILAIEQSMQDLPMLSFMLPHPCIYRREHHKRDFQCHDTPNFYQL